MRKFILAIFLAIGLASIVNTAQADSPSDFSIANVSFTTEKLEFTIRNIGGDVYTSNVVVRGQWLYQNKFPAGDSFDLGTHAFPRGLDPVKVVRRDQFLWNENLIPSDARYLMITVNPYTSAQERDPNNNSAEVARPLPDLTIDSIALDPTYGYPIVTIKNIGNSKAENYAFTVSYGWSISSRTYGSSYDVNLNLDPGQTYIAKAVNPSVDSALSPEINNVHIAIGRNIMGAYQIAESDYLNNEKTFDVDVAFPDLAIDSITFDPTYGYPVVAIKNIGVNTAKHPAFRISYNWSIRDPDTWVMNYRNLFYEVNLDLGPGQTFVAKPVNPSFDLAPDVLAGTINLNINRDIEGRGQIVESDYSNNYKDVDVAFPDLAIDSITFDPTYGYPVVAIKNIGVNTAKHPAFVVSYEYSTYDSDGYWLGNITRSYSVNLELNPNQTYIANIAEDEIRRANLALGPGIRSIVLTVGQKNNETSYQIFESDYGNNRQTANVVLPDLVVKSVNFDSSYSYPIVTIENIGTNAAKHPAFRISYKVNSAPRFYEVNLDLNPGQTFVAQPANPNLDSAFRNGIGTDLKIGQDVEGNEQIAEANYQNNKAALPDLAIDSVVFDSAAKKISITVGNIGPVKAEFYAEDMFGPTLKLTCYKVGESSAEGYNCEETSLAGGRDILDPGAKMTVNLRLPALWEDVKYIDVSVNSPIALSELNISNNTQNKIPVPLNLPKPALLWPTCTAEDSQENNFSVTWSWPEEQKASDYQVEVFDSTLVNSIYQEWTSNGTSFAMPTIAPVNTAFFAHYRSATDHANVSPWSDTALVVCAKSTLTATIEEEATSTEATSTTAAELAEEVREEIIEELAYPIAELGNCQSKDDCKAYCDKPENTEACTQFGISSGLMTEDEAEIAQTVSEISEASAGPGGCTSKESCEAYCEKPENVDACLDYAEQNNIMSTDDLAKARKVVQVLKEGVKTPGDCASPITCKNYCSDNAHAVECVAFGKSVGLLTAEEVEEAEKIAPLMQEGQMPGGSKTREETETYCETHRDECDAFFEQAGVKKGGATTTIFQKEENAESAGPGGCKTKEECDAYCDSHPGECDEQVKQAGGEVKEVTATCENKEECETFCDDPANKEAEACKSGTIIIKEESPESAGPTEGQGADPIEKLRSDIQGILPQSQDCVKQILGEEVFNKFIIERGIPEKAISREELQPCFEEAKRAVEQEEMLKMQKKPDDPDMGNPPPSGRISTFLASIINILNWFRK